MQPMAKKRKALKRRHQRVRQKITGTAARPRLAVYRSLRHLSAQLIDDAAGCTLVAVSTYGDEFGKDKYGGNRDAATVMGRLLAEKAKEKSISTVVFDRGGRQYHGRIKAFADAAREAGLKF